MHCLKYRIIHTSRRDDPLDTKLNYIEIQIMKTITKVATRTIKSLLAKKATTAHVVAETELANDRRFGF